MHKICIGQFVKPHGISGTLLLSFEEGFEDKIEDLHVLFAETDGILVPWFIQEDSVRITSSRTALIDLEWIEDNIQAKKLAGKKVWISSETGNHKTIENPQNLLAGYMVIDTSAGDLGVITEINDYSGNLVLTIEKNGTELLVPLHEDLVEQIDEQNRILTLKLPEGLISL